MDRVQTVSMLPRHEVSFTVLANLGKVYQLRLCLERKRLFASSSPRSSSIRSATMKVEAYYPQRLLISLVVLFCILALGPAMGGLMDCQAQEGARRAPSRTPGQPLDTAGVNSAPVLLNAYWIRTRAEEC